MPNSNPIINAYINKAEAFAQPILIHIRKLVHKAEPEITGVIKWGHVHFDFKGPVCYMAGYTKHCNFGFWKSALLDDPEAILKSEDAKSPLNGLTSIDDLPADEILIWYIRNAVDLNRRGIKYSPFKNKKMKEARAIPGDFADLLNSNIDAQTYFGDFSVSQRNEYIQWITEAKTDATRQKRMETAIEWLTEGKTRNWKYQ